ncbi:MAG TPA: hypothetical protein VGM10_12935 [Actinocrinis sp.]|jgi:hypothetical protein
MATAVPNSTCSRTVASALGDPEVVRRESRRLRAWIDSIES